MVMTVHPVPRLTGREKRVGGFDLMWNDGPVYMQDAIAADCIPNPSYPTNTFLGGFQQMLRFQMKRKLLSSFDCCDSTLTCSWPLEAGQDENEKQILKVLYVRNCHLCWLLSNIMF